MKGRAKSVIFNAIFSLSIITLVYMVSSAVYVYCFNNLEVKSYNQVSLNIQPMEYTLTKDEVRELIKDLYNTPHFYKETDNLASNRGAENYIFFRYVKVRKDVSIQDYAIYYAHELTHLKFMYGDETMTVFKTFVMLYESGNEQLKHMALVDAQNIINGGYRGTEYDCGFYILSYLNEKQHVNI